jgi:hypothetical protein
MACSNAISRIRVMIFAQVVKGGGGLGVEDYFVFLSF